MKLSDFTLRVDERVSTGPEAGTMVKSIETKSKLKLTFLFEIHSIEMSEVFHQGFK